MHWAITVGSIDEVILEKEDAQPNTTARIRYKDTNGKEHIFEKDLSVYGDDEEGNEVEFEYLDVVEVDGKEYIILLPVEEQESGEVVIFRVEGEGENETYIGLEDEEEAEKVFNLFKEKAKDDFDFAD